MEENKALQLESNKNEFIELLRSTKRKNIEELIEWLETRSDFFTAPSSAKYHGNYEGGLCEHSLNVYHVALQIKDNILPLSKKFDGTHHFSDNELIIACLLHDLCKVNFYEITEKWKKDETKPMGQQWVKYTGYTIKDKLPLGHGEKSMFMAQNFIQLTANEALAINHHMNFFNPSMELNTYQHSAFMQAVENYPLVGTVALADAVSSFMIEVRENPPF